MFKINCYDVLKEEIGQRMDGFPTLLESIGRAADLLQGFPFNLSVNKRENTVVIIPVKGCPFPCLLISEDK